MADIEIKARITADTSDATKGVDKLNNSLGSTKKSTSDSVGSFGKLKDTIGAISPSAEGAIGALEGVSKTMWKLVANPVGAIILAIVAALALLYKSFTNSFEGGQKMEQIFAGIKAAGQALIDNIEKIVGAIAKLMRFDFSGAISDIKGVVKEAGEAYSAMAKLTEEAQRLHQEQLANDLDQSKRAKDLAILKEKAYDESVPVAERRKLLLQLKAESEKNAKDDIDLAKRTTDNKIAQLTLQKDGAKKNQDEINKLKIEQNNVETQNANELRAISKQIRNIDKADAAEQKKIQDENNANTKKYLELKNKIINDANLAAIQDEVKVNIQKVLNQEKDKIKEIEALKTSEKNKAELIAMIKQSSLQEIAKIEREDKIKKAKIQADFDLELNKLHIESLLSGVKDARAKEQAALDLGFEDKFNQAKEKYKTDAIKLQQVQEELAIQQRNAQAALDDKFDKEDKEKKKKKDEEQAALKTELLNPYDKEIAQLEEAYKKKLEIAKGNEALIAAVEKEYAESKTALKSKHLNDQLNETKSVGDNIASVIGQQTAVGKGIGVANALINTYQGATDALRAKSTLPSPFDVIAKVANVAAVLASGFKAVKAITSVQVPGAGGGGGGAVPSVPSPITPQQISTQLNSASIQGVGNAASAGAGRSFVLDTDIKDNQERQARINRAARLG